MFGIHVWLAIVIHVQVCYVDVQHTCTPGIIYFYHTAYSLSAFCYVFAYAFAHSIGAVLVYFH